MNKILNILLLGALTSVTLMADFTRVEMGAGVWSSKASGSTSYVSGATSGEDISTENSESNPYLWVLIKHPIPVLSNLRLEYADTTNKGTASGTFADFTTTANTTTQLDFTQYDIIPYYNILDNTPWVTLDIGVDIKLIDTNLRADNVTPTVGGGTTYSESILLPIPLLYTRVRFEIPTTDIGLEADAKFISYSDSTVYDVRIKIDYTLDFIPVIQPAVEVGYRKQKYKIDEADLDGKIDLGFSGIYVGAMLRF